MFVSNTCVNAVQAYDIERQHYLVKLVPILKNLIDFIRLTNYWIIWPLYTQLSVNINIVNTVLYYTFLPTLAMHVVDLWSTLHCSLPIYTNK